MFDHSMKLSGTLAVAILVAPSFAYAVDATSPPEAAKGLAETGGGAGAELPDEDKPVAAGEAAEGAPAPKAPARPPSATGAPVEGLPEARPGHVVPSQDANFLVKAANSGQAEVELARVAIERASSAPVKEHAQRMLEDHRKANEKLKQIAADKNFPLPDQLTGVHRNLVQQLRDEQPADFDQAYMQAQVGEHKAAVALFRDEKNEGKDPELREFAASELPTLEQHLEEALTIAEDIIAVGGEAAPAAPDADAGTPAGSQD